MANTLTRRDARVLSNLNKGYNRGQFQYAMTNAKQALRDNTDLKGKALRQRAREIVAGVSSEREMLPQIQNLPKLDTNTTLQTPSGIQGMPIITRKDMPDEIDLSNYKNFNAAFGFNNPGFSEAINNFINRISPKRSVRNSQNPQNSGFDKYYGYNETNPVNTFNPRTDHDSYTQRQIGRWRWILDHPDSYDLRILQSARENLPVYESRYPTW